MNKYCPMSFNSDAFRVCNKYSCAWWDMYHEMCSIRSLSENMMESDEIEEMQQRMVHYTAQCGKEDN
ncbi:Uncharacterised protein [uncultured Ruminococcus sp.]|nr:Uncharacterised protein [uncultured Ruminococcus sp.]